ncbi:MAG TPA: 1-acyl-sn-glycerol-3-phosphate acyltransferase [Nocardioidaceae bacterium]
MADAEIIPIGTRGRPGRGTGSARPSASARNLAGTARPKPTADPTGKAGAAGRSASTGAAARKRAKESQPVDTPAGEAPETGAAAPEQDVPAATRRAGKAAATDGRRGPTEPAASDEGGRTERPTSGTTTEERVGDGIPVGDWLAAFSTAAREIFGEEWEPRLAEFLAFLRRRVTGDYTVDEYGFDAEVTERFFYAAIRPIADKWFRVEVRGAENIPTEGGALVVSNHSGTIPMDGLVTGVSIHDHTGRHLRPLGADLVFRLPIVGELARKGGATLACNDDAERMLRGGELVGVWPEGFKGIGKPYSDRYKLQRFGRGGFVSAALRTGVPIIPCSVVGAEEIYPLVGNLPSLARLLGVPYIPITPFFPLLGPLGLVPLPSKWLIEFGEPIRTDSYDDGAADDPMLVFNVTDQVRETIQQTLYSLLMQRRSVFH